MPEARWALPLLAVFLLTFGAITPAAAAPFGLSSPSGLAGLEIVRDDALGPGDANRLLVRDGLQDADGNRIEDGLDGKAATMPEATVYVHVLYGRRPTQFDAILLRGWYGALQTYVFDNFDRIKVETTAGEAARLLQAPGVLGLQEFVPSTLDNDVGARALRVRADATMGDGLDHGQAVHGLGYNGTGMVVAVLDTGVDHKHPFLNDMDGWDGTDGPKQVLGVTVDSGFEVVCVDPVDDYGHGSHVAGTAVGTGGQAGETNGLPGELEATISEPGRHAGSAPGARYIDIDIAVNLGAQSLGQGEDVAFDWIISYNAGDAACAEAADEAVDRIDVATMSFGAGGDAPGSARAILITSAVRSGITITLSGGNSACDTGTCGNPGELDQSLTTGAEGAIIVAAADDRGTVSRADDLLAGFSSRGKRPSDGDSDTKDEQRPDIAAPGVDIQSANYQFTKVPAVGELATMSGTSMATPFIAGVAALLLEAHPDLRPVDRGADWKKMGSPGAVPIRDLMQKTATYKTATEGAAPQVTEPGNFGRTWNNAWGYGLVDAFAAMCFAWETSGEIPPGRVAAGCGLPGGELFVDPGAPVSGSPGDVLPMSLNIAGGTAPYATAWEIVSGPTGATVGPQSQFTTFSASTAGAYVLEATVTDAVGASVTVGTTVQLTTPSPMVYYLYDNPASVYRNSGQLEGFTGFTMEMGTSPPTKPDPDAVNPFVACCGAQHNSVYNPGEWHQTTPVRLQDANVTVTWWASLGPAAFALQDEATWLLGLFENPDFNDLETAPTYSLFTDGGGAATPGVPVELSAKFEEVDLDGSFSVLIDSEALTPELTILYNAADFPSRVSIEMPPDRQAPGAATGLATTTNATAGSVRLNWTAPAQDVVSHYLVQRAPSAGGPFTTVSAPATSPFTDFPGAGSHVYRVAAVDRAGNVGAYSPTASASLAGGNLPPVLAAIGEKAVNEAVQLSVPVAATDANAGDTLTVAVATNATGATFVQNANGKWLNWTPTKTQAGAYWANVSVSDGAGGSDFENLTITVANPAPVLVAIGPRSGTVGQSLSVAIAATDADGDMLTLSRTTNTTGSTLEQTGPASWSFNVTPGQAGTAWADFLLSDGQASDAENVTLTFAEASNTAPVLTDVGSKAATAGHWLNFTMVATDADGDTVTFGWETNATKSGQLNAATGAFSWSIPVTAAGTYWANYSVSDGRGGLDFENVTLAIAAPTNEGGSGEGTVANAPAIEALATAQAAYVRGQPFAIEVTGRAFDANFASDLADITASWVDPDGVRSDVAAVTVVRSDPDTGNATFNFTVHLPADARIGTYTVDVNATDNGGLFDVASVTFDVLDEVLTLGYDGGKTFLDFGTFSAGASNVRTRNNFTVVNNGATPTYLWFEMGDLRNATSGGAIPVAGNAVLNVTVGSLVMDVPYASAVKRVVLLQPGDTATIGVVLGSIPSPLASGRYTTSFAVFDGET